MGKDVFISFECSICHRTNSSEIMKPGRLLFVWGYTHSSFSSFYWGIQEGLAPLM